MKSTLSLLVVCLSFVLAAQADDSVGPYHSLRILSDGGRIWIVEYWQEESYVRFVVFSGPTNAKDARSYVTNNSDTANSRSPILTTSDGAQRNLLLSKNRPFQLYQIVNPVVHIYKDKVTAQEFQSFLASKSSAYTAKALLAHADKLREKSK